MMSLLIAFTFLAMLLAPCLITLEPQPKEISEKSRS